MLAETKADGKRASKSEAPAGLPVKRDHVSTSLSKFMDRLAKWTDEIMTPEFRAYQNQRISYILADDLEHDALASGDFKLGEQIENQHRLITSFLHLHASGRVLGQCEHYFKRYPFRGSPVTRDDHARNMCEFYLGNVYILRSRLKTFLNNMVKTCPEIRINVGATIKEFDRAFDQELRMRNGVTHHEPFSDVMTEKMSIIGIMAKHPNLKGARLEHEHLRAYRQFMNSWARRAKQRTQVVELLVNEIAEMLVKRAPFLSASDVGPTRSA